MQCLFAFGVLFMVPDIGDNIKILSISILKQKEEEICRKRNLNLQIQLNVMVHIKSDLLKLTLKSHV